MKNHAINYHLYMNKLAIVDGDILYAARDSNFDIKLSSQSLKIISHMTLHYFPSVEDCSKHHFPFIPFTNIEH